MDFCERCSLRVDDGSDQLGFVSSYCMAEDSSKRLEQRCNMLADSSSLYLSTSPCAYLGTTTCTEEAAV